METLYHFNNSSATNKSRQIPFNFQRKQFFFHVCFFVTMNKVQAQTLLNVGIYDSVSIFPMVRYMWLLSCLIIWSCKASDKASSTRAQKFISDKYTMTTQKRKSIKPRMCIF